MISLTINNRKVLAEEGMTILEAARLNHIKIPSFCHLEGVHQAGACRICVVEVEGAKTLQASCMVEAREGMVVRTNTERVRNARKLLYELILSDHPKDCLNCERNQSCELQALGELIGLEGCRLEGERSKGIVDDSSPSIVRDLTKCILCRRCATICNDIQGIGVLNAQNRGFKTVIGPADDLPLNQVNCTYCGQCTVVCPVGALQEKSSIGEVWRALSDPKKRTIVQTAPAVRAALGEEFGYEPGTLVTGKMVTALKEIGFADVFDTNFAADLTILEEGSELLERVKAALTGGKSTHTGNGAELVEHADEHAAPLPMITSCSPGWIKYIEHTYPEEIGHLSTCKSPHMMLGALAKSYYANKLGLDAENIHVTSIMPCTAKKFEISRPQMMNDGHRNVDAVLTTRELARMIRESGVDFKTLEEGEFDHPLGLSTGAADIFGATGGVMEAALRTVYELVTGRPFPFEKLHVKSLIALDQIKTAELLIKDPLEEYKFLDGVTVKVAVTSGFKGAKLLMDQIVKGESPYHFIEVMGCPGGCISGGGQPRPTDRKIRQKRLEAILREDEGKQLRKSHENPLVASLYAEFLGRPLGHVSHDLLHTTYTKRGKKIGIH